MRSKLYSAINIRGKKIINRVVMPPMVCFNWADKTGILTNDHLKHYEERAKGGTGLIILEAHAVDKEGRLADSQLGIWSDKQISRLQELAARCHKYDTKLLVQIHHAGYKTDKAVSDDIVAPSDYQDNKISARGITVDEIKRLKDNLITAAVRAEKADLDGIELHGAHGYILNQFLSPDVNKREDNYGGGLEGRLTLAKEIIKGIKKEVSEDFIIGYRLGANTPDLTTGIEAARMLQNYGVDLMNVSAGIGDKPIIPEDFPYNWIVYCGTEIYKNLDIPVIVVNEIREPKQAEYLVDNNLTDMVAVGRGLLVEPYWTNKGQEGISINPCLECKRCQWFKDGYNCPGRK